MWLLIHLYGRTARDSLPVLGNTQFQNFKKLPTPAFFLLVPGFTVFRQEGKDKFQPADWELLKAHFWPSWEEPSAGKGTRKGNQEVFCTSSLSLFQGLVGFALGQVKPLVMAVLQLAVLHVSIKTVMKPLWQGEGGRATWDTAAKKTNCLSGKFPFSFSHL